MGLCCCKSSSHPQSKPSDTLIKPDNSSFIHPSLASLNLREKLRREDPEVRLQELKRALSAPKLELHMSGLYVKRKSLRVPNAFGSAGEEE